MRPIALDIETSPVDPNMKEHAALEPWRVRQKLAYISSIAYADEDGNVKQILNDFPNKFSVEWVERIIAFLEPLAGKEVFAHFSPFDLAFMIASIQPDRMGDIPQVIRDIKWRDSALLARWICNGQLAEATRFSYALANLCKIFLADDPMTADFLKMKSESIEAGDDSGYWEERGELDVIMTQKLVMYLLPKLQESQRIGFLVEMKNLVPIANSWIIGLRIDTNQLDKADREYSSEMDSYLSELGIAATVVSSPKQLSNLLFNVWGLKPHSTTAKGSPSTAGDDMKWIQYKLIGAGYTDHAKKLGLLIKAKTISTLKSKYVKTMREALAHTGDGYIYGAPRIFGTYTGRMTYANATRKKYKTGIALHQMPRKAKAVREMIIAPDGYIIYEADAAGQESRLMALKSNDPVMIEVFQANLNFHSMTGATIIGMEYLDFETARKEEGDSGYYTEQRQLGKLANLSCNFRISGKSLSEKSFVDYDTYMDIATGNYLVNTWQSTYAGVKTYWSDSIDFAKTNGYAEAFGGRRFKINEWASRSWASESSAINVPIQGSGASMKEIAIAETYVKVPEAKFILDLHDASFFYVKAENSKETCDKLDDTLNGIDYTPYWGFTPVIKLPYDSKFGKSFAEVK